MNNDSVTAFNELKCCVIIPTYNNAKTLKDVVVSVQHYTNNIIVVNDGSTDTTNSILNEIEGIEKAGYSRNRGKGFAIRTGFKRALELGYKYAITMDSDGQHYASDIPVFINALSNKPNHIFIGGRIMEGQEQAKSSGLANRISNFWFSVETGMKLPDTQSGYRLYPIKILEKKKWFCYKYEFEIEILVRSVWEGIAIDTLPISVLYQSKEERVSHFRPFKDFTRISILNTVLVTLAFLYYRPRMIIQEYKGKSLKEIIRTQLRNDNESNVKIASAIGFGVFMGVFPVWGYQLLMGFFIAHLLKLNKALFFVAANISLPPMIPVILYLSYVMGSFMMGEGSWQVDIDLTIKAISTNIKQYLIGAVGLSFFLGGLFYLLSYALLSLVKRRKRDA